MLDPTEFFEAAREYAYSADNSATKGRLRFATVDSSYSGSGPARVLFDGETVLTNKAYNFISVAPAAGSRVMMTPVSTTYVITGMLNGGA